MTNVGYLGLKELQLTTRTSDYSNSQCNCRPSTIVCADLPFSALPELRQETQSVSSGFIPWYRLICALRTSTPASSAISSHLSPFRVFPLFSALQPPSSSYCRVSLQGKGDSQGEPSTHATRHDTQPDTPQPAERLQQAASLACGCLCDYTSATPNPFFNTMPAMIAKKLPAAALGLLACVLLFSALLGLTGVANKSVQRQQAQQQQTRAEEATAVQGLRGGLEGQEERSPVSA